LTWTEDVARVIRVANVDALTRSRVLFLWLPPLLWTGMIALFSSSALSGESTGAILKALLPWTDPGTLEILHGVIRKFGHVGEYALLTALWDRALRAGTDWSGAAVAGTVLLLSVGTAGLDELHQAWTPDRTGSLLDVVLDGGASGITEWGLSYRARGGSFLWKVAGLLAWTGALLGTLFLAVDWSLSLPVTGLLASSGLAWGVLLARRYWRTSLTHRNHFS